MGYSAPLVIFLVVCATLGLTGINPDQATGIDRSNSGFVAGTVVDAQSGAPIQGAVVTLLVSMTGSTPTPPTYFRALSDRDGHFSISRASATRCLGLFADAAGYLRSDHRQLSAVENCQALADVRFRLWGGAAITGRVTGGGGQSVPNVLVRVFRESLIAGRRRLVADESTARTDDRGNYRLAGLAPGRYVVALASLQVTTPPTTGGQSQALPPRLLPVLYAVSLTNSTPSVARLLTPNGLLRSFGQPLPIQRNAGSAANSIYPPVFYPEATSPAGALRLNLSPSAVVSDIDFRLVPAPAVRVSGRVIPPSPIDDQIVLSIVPATARDTGIEAGFQTAACLTDPAGAFSLLGVVPDDYILTVNYRKQRSSPSGPLTFSTVDGMLDISSSGGADFSRLDPTWWAEQPLTVRDDAVTDLDVPLQRGLTISGRIEFNGTADRPSGERLRQMILNVEPPTGPIAGTALAAGQAIIETGGVFRSSEIPRGSYFVRAGRVPEPWYVSSIQYEGRNIADVPMSLDRDTSGITVTLSDSPAVIFGTVRLSSGEVVSRGVVIAFPTDPMMWTDFGITSPRLRKVGLGRDGEYEIRGVFPGEYCLAALLDTPTFDDWRAPEFLAQLRPRCSPVSIRDGRRLSVDVRLAPQLKERDSSRKDEVRQ